MFVSKKKLIGFAKEKAWPEIRSYVSLSSCWLAACVLISFFLLQHKDGFVLSSLILLGGAGAFFCRQKGLRFAFLIFLCILTCVERHFILHYGESFRECGAQALITLNITDKEEVIAYISMLKAVEYACVAVFLSAAVLTLIPRFQPAAGPGKKFSIGIGTGSLLCLAGFAAAIAFVPVRNYVHDWKEQGEFLLKRSQFRFHAKDPMPDSPAVHFLLIGESHRKDEFDSIVLHGGSPVLTQAGKDGALFEFDDVISYYQQTFFSVFTLLSRRGGGSMSANFEEKGLFSLFREAGWKVYYVTYQPKTLSATGYDCVVNEADIYVNARQKTGIKYDSSFLEVIDRILQKKEKKVLLVMKMSGCHFHYSTRYPQGKRYCKYQPAYPEKISKSQYKVEEKEILINTYRNAMLFSAEFFDGIARRCRDLQIPSFLFFLSDHGVVNYDDGKNPFFGAARSNFHIPCLCYVNEAYRKTMKPERIAAMKKNRTLPAGNDYVFDTLVSLAGLEYPGYRKNLDMTSLQARPAGNRKVWVWKKTVPYDSLQY